MLPTIRKAQSISKPTAADYNISAANTQALYRPTDNNFDGPLGVLDFRFFF